MFSIDTPSVADRFALTLDGLCRAVAARVARGAMAVAMIVLVWQRIRRVESRLLRLLARFRAGRVMVRVVPQGVVRGGRAGGGVSGVPRGLGWLLPLMPSEAACFAGQLRTVLAEPEMVALLAASPQAGRVLAPLCRMLGIVLAELEPVAAVPVRAVVNRVAVPAGRPALPPGVIVAARREGGGRLS